MKRSSVALGMSRRIRKDLSAGVDNFREPVDLDHVIPTKVLDGVRVEDDKKQGAGDPVYPAPSDEDIYHSTSPDRVEDVPRQLVKKSYQIVNLARRLQRRMRRL